MSEYRIQSETLEAIGDAIRSKTGGSALITPEDMADEIASIGAGSIPNTIQPVEYIGNNGTGFVPLNYTISSGNIRFVLEYYCSSKPDSEGCFFGASSGRQTVLEIGLSNTNGRIFAYSNSSAGINNLSSLYGNVVKVDAEFFPTSPYKTLSVTIDGTTYTSTDTPTGNDSFIGQTLSAFSSQTDSYTLPFIGRLFGLTVYENGIKCMELIPCYRKADGKIGFYDVLRAIFLEAKNQSAMYKGEDLATESDYIDALNELGVNADA